MSDTEARPRVVVVDDAAVIRDSFTVLMTRLDVIEAFPTVESMIARRLEADLVVLDLHLANASQPDVRQGIAATRALVRRGYRVCIYSQEERRFVLAACIAAGAKGVASKSLPTAKAEEVFLEVAAGGVAVPQALIGLMEVLVRRDCITVLSDRQRQVLAGRARGMSYGQLAKKLYVGETTLRGYWRDITASLSAYLQSATPSEIEQALGLAPGDLLDYWPGDDDGDRWWRVGRAAD